MEGQKDGGASRAITLPSHIAELYDSHKGDYVECPPIGTGEFRIKKEENRKKIYDKMEE